MAVMGGARRTEAVVMLAISIDRDLVYRKSFDP